MTVTTTGAINSGGVLTATLPSGGAIPGGGTAALAYQVSCNYPLLGGFTFQITQVGPLNIGFAAFTFVINETGLTPGTYTGQALTSMCGVATGVQATIVVGGGGTITSITVSNGGFNCASQDAFSFSFVPLGGTGTGQVQYNSGSALASSAAIGINAYGTGGTTGTGSNAGTYSTTALGAAQSPSSGAGVTSGTSFWIAYGNGTPAPASTVTPPSNQMQPVPTVAASSFSNIPVPLTGATAIPPAPLPQTLIGTTNISSYAI